MALISTIRNSKFLLIVLLGGGLLAFILMDVTMNQNKNVASDFTLGKVNGKAIDYKEFRQMGDALYSGANVDRNQVNDYLWNYFLEKEIVEEEAQELGLSVGKDELLELQFGQNLSPVIRNRFSNQQTGQVDREQLNAIRQQIQDGTFRQEGRVFWKHQENEIIKTRLQSKLNALVAKGIYTPTWLAQEQGKLQSASASVAYVNIPFSEVDDTEINITEEDYQNYINDRESLFSQDQETRVLSYVKIDVKPTSEDSMSIKESVSDLIPDFRSATNDSLYAINNNGYFSGIYQTKKELQGNVPDTLFSQEVGTIYGPVEKNGAYVAYKIIDKMTVPDSISARHILLRVNEEDPASLSSAKTRIDSFKNAINSGSTTFEEMASKFGQDGTKTKEGDLGTFGKNAMVKPFNDLVFYKAEKGKLYTVNTQFGIHLVEVTDKVFENNDTGIKFSLVQEPIVPSKATQDSKYDEAIDLINSTNEADAFKAKIADMDGMEMVTSQPLTAAGYQVTGIQDSEVGRSMVKWLFNRDKLGEVSPDIFIVKQPNLLYNQNYIIATRDKIIPAGVPSVDDIKEQIQGEVSKLKKGEVLVSQLQGMTDLQAIANKYDIDVDTLPNVNFSSSSIPGLGSEPKLLGTIFTTPSNSVSNAVAGNNGVYVVKVLSKQDGNIPTNVAPLRKSISNQLANSTGSNLLKSLVDKAEIDDRRNKFL